MWVGTIPEGYPENPVEQLLPIDFNVAAQNNERRPLGTSGLSDMMRKAHRKNSKTEGDYYER